MKDNKHIFAFYVPDLNEFIHNNTLVLQDKELYHRLAKVTRLTVGDAGALFDVRENVQFLITSVSKKHIEATITARKKNKSLEPYITLYLPLLKKDAFAQAVYTAVEVGANEIQLVTTEKSRQHLLHNEWDRLERMVIAAAEQSKQFAVPRLKKPIAFSDIASCDTSIFCDPEGMHMRDCTKKVPISVSSLCMMIGPEGDLTTDEKSHLAKRNWLFVALTPTILRSVQSVSVGLGVLRCFFRTD